MLCMVSIVYKIFMLISVQIFCMVTELLFVLLIALLQWKSRSSVSLFVLLIASQQSSLLLCHRVDRRVARIS